MSCTYNIHSTHSQYDDTLNGPMKNLVQLMHCACGRGYIYVLFSLHEKCQIKAHIT